MWARVVECMMGCWLLMSPFVFHHEAAETALWVNDLTIGCMVIVLSLLSFWHRTGWSHWVLLLPAAWLVGFGRFWQTPPLPPALQNNILVGLLLFMFAILPNDASLPPKAWRD